MYSTKVHFMDILWGAFSPVNIVAICNCDLSENGFLTCRNFTNGCAQFICFERVVSQNIHSSYQSVVKNKELTSPNKSQVRMNHYTLNFEPVTGLSLYSEF